MADERQTAAQIHDFEPVWRGGFFAGDPLDDMGSPYDLFGYYSAFHVVYLACIRQYVTPETCALEIGPGRGAWTRTLLGAKEVWALDALSAEHNDFWGYVGDQPHVHSYKVDDFTASMLPNDRIDYVFSYDTLCHVTFDGIEAYARNLYPKLRTERTCSGWSPISRSTAHSSTTGSQQHRVAVRAALRQPVLPARARAAGSRDGRQAGEEVRGLSRAAGRPGGQLVVPRRHAPHERDAGESRVPARRRGRRSRPAQPDRALREGLTQRPVARYRSAYLLPRWRTSRKVMLSGCGL